MLTLIMDFKTFLSVVLFFLCQSAAQDEVKVLEVISGDPAELPCNVTSEKEGDKLNILAWYRNGSTTAIYSRDLRDDLAGGTEDGDKFQMITEDEVAFLKINRVDKADAGLYHCLADFATSPAHKTFVDLKVIELPENLWINIENGTRIATASPNSNITKEVGPYFVGDSLHLICVAFGGKPQSKLSWWSEGELFDTRSLPISEYRIRSDLRYKNLEREDCGRVFSCVARNNNITSPIIASVVVDMMLGPELIKVHRSGQQSGGDQQTGGSASVAAGDPLSVECRVLGARPPPDIVWMLDNGHLYNLEQNVTRNPSQSLVSSVVQLTVGRDRDEVRVSCCVPSYDRDGPQYQCSDPLPVTVTYPPILSIVVEGHEDENGSLSVMKGSTVKLNCRYEANPPVTEIFWHHEDDVISTMNDKVIDSELVLENVQESAAGEYVCGAINKLEDGPTFSPPIILDIVYPPYCKEPNETIYGVADGEPMNITCDVWSNPAPTKYGWAVIIKDSQNTSEGATDQPSKALNITDNNVLLFERPNKTVAVIFCFGVNNVTDRDGVLPNNGCVFVITNETAPRPPSRCNAVKKLNNEITVTCQKGHDGGLPQKFTLQVLGLESNSVLTTIMNIEPQFIVQEPTYTEDYRLTIVATNEKGDSRVIEIYKQDITDETDGSSPLNTVTDISTLSLSLCGGVALIALTACGLVLCAHDRESRPDVQSTSPPLQVYTDESNCDTANDSDGSDYNTRRTDSLRRSRRPSRTDMKRTSSFHSARLLHEIGSSQNRIGETSKHRTHCRVHSMQNIRNKDIDNQCDSLVMRLPEDTSYAVPKAMNTFYTIPRKVRCRTRDVSEITSEVSNGDGLSLPPPPDEFTSFRAASRLSDVPKPPPVYSTIRKPPNVRDPTKYSNVIISPLNTVGLPATDSYYLYANPDDKSEQKTPFDSD